MSHSFAAAAVIGVATAWLLHRRLGARLTPLAVYFAARLELLQRVGLGASSPASSRCSGCPQFW